MNRKAIIAAVIIAVIALGGIAYALSVQPKLTSSSTNSTSSSTSKKNPIADPAHENNSTTHTETKDEAPANSAQTSGQNASITFTDSGFEPSKLTVKKGTTVTVINKSSEPLEFSSADHPTHRHNTELNMDVLEPGQSGELTVNVIGSHGYHDHLDKNKTGTLVVTE